ncbi:exopolysaccharide biosynthesis polyprenyl glycosylphosphotransferase [Streptomyces sp. HPF1205]|uniref:exopolysaccharide biosynthesis polyprenyl glycosylphosphotransferase n=1 Tax=Streptomyces sp. HPF1205 TaxID=2873262 RepID=UPI001CEDA35F|nr:exopolysaccharide biosynthesis polyprenyl glycosylphosphotransferase [Streptomyces sp. HPF1205]
MTRDTTRVPPPAAPLPPTTAASPDQPSAATPAFAAQAAPAVPSDATSPPSSRRSLAATPRPLQPPQPPQELRPLALSPAASTPRGLGRRPAARGPRLAPRVGLPLVAMDGAAALCGAYAVGPDAGPYLAGPVVAVLLLAHRRAGLYGTRFAPGALEEVPAVVTRVALAWAPAAAGLAAVAPGLALAWPTLLAAVAVTSLTACLLRALVYGIRRSYGRRHPAAALVVGPASSAGQVAAALVARPEYGMRPVGLIPTGSAGAPAGPATGAPTGVPTGAAPGVATGLLAGAATDTGQDQYGLPVLTTPGGLARAVHRHTVRHVLVVGPEGLDHRAGAALRLLAAHECRLWHLTTAPPAANPRWPRAAHLWGFACHPLDPAPAPGGSRGGARIAKRTLDALAAAAALLVLAPVLLGCALAVRIGDGRGVLFRQERVGAGGRPFTLLKFRTLRPRDEHEAATRWSIADDRRMSAVGRFLRRTSLDELPQLWNVLRGDMSLVGPRPERPYFVRRFSQAHPGYQDRHRVPVGITGLAQVHGLRGDTSIADRARFDNHYIDTWSFWQDVVILLRTARSVFRLGGS